MTVLRVEWPDGLDFTAMEAVTNAIEHDHPGCKVTTGEGLAMAKPEIVATLVALDVLLLVSRTSPHAITTDPELEASLAVIEGLRNKIREVLR
jgi:hypothetical protein